MLPAPPSQRKVKWSDKGATSLSPIKSSIITYAPRRAGRERGDEEAERIGQGTVENIIFFQVIRFPPALFFFVSVMGGNRITYRMKEYYIYYPPPAPSFVTRWWFVRIINLRCYTVVAGEPDVVSEGPDERRGRKEPSG